MIGNGSGNESRKGAGPTRRPAPSATHPQSDCAPSGWTAVVGFPISHNLTLGATLETAAMTIVRSYCRRVRRGSCRVVRVRPYCRRR